MHLNYKTYPYIFLDRDGVINIERPNDYIKDTEGFTFINGVCSAINLLNKFASKVFVITNQRCVGRGIISENKLLEIHTFMQEELCKYEAKIDKIYYCMDTSPYSINRKPNIGMGFQTIEDYPEIDFQNSIMIGNSLSDIQFGNKLGMKSVLVGDKYPKEHEVYTLIDAYFVNLPDFVKQYAQDK